MKQFELRLNHIIFKPSLIGTVITALCIPLFIHFGMWQYQKAQQKQKIQEIYNKTNFESPKKFPLDARDLKDDDWNYQKITLSGEYETKYQILLDNQVEGSRVGYHVITPLKIENSSKYVLINRGWILGKDIHSDLPVFDTPKGKQIIVGQIWVPSKKIFTLEKDTSASHPGQLIKFVWQHMNMRLYQQNVPFEVSPMAIKLDPESAAGGFLRNWQVPTQRIITHMGYAYQWFGFAVAAFLIYMYVSLSRVQSEIKSRFN